MSSLWTPGGEHPVDRDRPAPAPPPDAEQPSPEDQERAREMAEQLAEAQRRLAEVPAAVVVANHVMGLFELGAIHLNQQPPNLTEARLAIDAMGAVLDGVRGRLGQDEPTLRSALDQIRLAYVQLSSESGAPAGDATGTTGPPG
jgi:hypothetical protein